MAADPDDRVQEGWHPPRPPAPGGLRLVQLFVNSDDDETATDEFADPAALQRWLVLTGLLKPEAPVAAGDCAAATELRGALRALLLANHERDPAPPVAARAVLDKVARAAVLTPRFRDGDGAELEPAVGGVAGALGRVVAVVYDAMKAGTWERMKACRNDTCQWAFYDHSRNRSGAWCQMESCGSQAKMRSYRARQKHR